jgi:CRISPR/Cas system-associated protein Cas10 (large subunit of type III CRISPR-Cas system)
MSNNFEILRICALLHDIGKPECWANKKPWSEHIHWTYNIVKESLGENLASIARHHHAGPYYPREYYPANELEKIIFIADNLASGADRREEPRRFTPYPKPPVHLTHVLSGGSVVRKSFDERQLAYVSKVLAQKIGEIGKAFGSCTKEAYLRIFSVLENSKLRNIPADTREPINDVSLWNHLKLTVAFATCIWLDGGYKGDELSRYDFALLCGDADKISAYIGVSKRLQDLNARSESIKEATRAAANVIVDILGPECLIYAAGGGFLAVSSKDMAKDVVSKAKKAFEEVTNGQVTITVNYVCANGNEIQRNFGRVWRCAQREMRIKKSGRRVLLPEPIEEGIEVCDVCGLRPWVHEDSLKIMRIDAAPRPERLCDVCWDFRKKGKGVPLDELCGRSNFVALLKADGDDMGKVLGGDVLKKLDKANTPSRLSGLSELIHAVCEKELRGIVAKYGGQCLFAGGDDILAFVPGDKGLEAARSIAYRFRGEMNEKCTMSVGVAIFHHDLPVYVGLEVAGYLLKRAKESGKNRVAFAIVGGAGVTFDELEERVIPRKWYEVDEILRIIDFMRSSGVASSKIRQIARISKDFKQLDKAEIFIKHLMGKGVIDWREGEKFLSYLKTGLLYDAFLMFNLFKET